MNVPGHVVLSRPDAVGDAVVTLTTAGWIKHHAPSTRITVITKAYARAVWQCSTHADRIITLEELESAGDAGAPELLRGLRADAIVHVFPHRSVARWAKRAGIPRRIGTGHRWWHWTTCNERVSFSRQRSLLHEGQLNGKLLAPFGLPMPPDVASLVPVLGFVAPLPAPRVKALFAPGKKHLVVHPLLGSGVGWGLHNHAALLRALDPARWQVFVTGTAAEADRYRGALPLDAPHVRDLGGALSLEELITLIAASDALVAASTGPLHIAAACGIRAIGLFSMRRPIFPARWAPIGRDAHALVHDNACPDCAAGRACTCITRIPVQRVLDLLRDIAPSASA